MPIVQSNNNESKALTASRFRRLNNPVHAWGDVHSFVMSLPGLVGYWPGAVDIGASELLDVSGNGLHLTRNGDAKVGLDPATPFATYTAYDGTGDYFSHADDARLDIQGNESIIHFSDPGLVAMAWVWLNDISSALDRGIISKWTVAAPPQRSYMLNVREAEGAAEFLVSGNGSASFSVVTEFDLLLSDTWHFVAGRYATSSIEVWLDLNYAINQTSIPSTLFNGTSVFAVGSAFGDIFTGDMDGRIAHPVLCASRLSRLTIETFYQMTAPLFGKQV